LAVKINGKRGTQQEISVSKKTQKKLYHLKGIPNLRVWCKNDPVGHLESESEKKSDSDSDSQCS